MRFNAFLLVCSVAGIVVLLVAPIQVSARLPALAIILVFAFDQLRRALVSTSFRDDELRIVNYWRSFRTPISDVQGFRITND